MATAKTHWPGSDARALKEHPPRADEPPRGGAGRPAPSVIFGNRESEMQTIASEPKGLTRRPRARARATAKPGRIIVHPFHSPEGLDVTDAIVAAIAHEIWKRHDGNAVLNWIEAERCLAEALARRASTHARSA